MAQSREIPISAEALAGPHIVAGAMREHRPLLVAFAARLLGSRDDAEDVVQEALLAAHQHAARYDGRSGPRPWLLGIVANHCRSWWRTHHRRLQRERRAAAPSSAPDPEPNGLVLAAVLDLPLRLREPLVLHYLGDLSYREVGEALGLSEDAARQRVHRARARLRILLRAELKEVL